MYGCLSAVFGQYGERRGFTDSLPKVNKFFSNCKYPDALRPSSWAGDALRLSAASAPYSLTLSSGCGRLFPIGSRGGRGGRCGCRVAEGAAGPAVRSSCRPRGFLYSCCFQGACSGSGCRQGRCRDAAEIPLLPGSRAVWCGLRAQVRWARAAGCERRARAAGACTTG